MTWLQKDLAIAAEARQIFKAISLKISDFA